MHKYNPVTKAIARKALDDLPPITPEMRKKFAEQWRGFVEEQTPNADNTCKKPKCSGKIVKHVSSLFRGQYHFGTPKCELCGRNYQFAPHAVETGVKEFEEMMIKPFTI